MKTIALLLAISAVGFSEELMCPSSQVCPSIVPREAWGARAPKTVMNYPCIPDLVVIIHTETHECSDTQSCYARLHFMQDLHMDSNGWEDIGYNFVIGEDGIVFEGTGWDVVGTHTRGFNSRSISIAFIGNYNDHLPSPTALEAAQNLIACGVALHKLPRVHQIVGHRQLINTTSPGEQIFNQIKTWPAWTEYVQN